MELSKILKGIVTIMVVALVLALMWYLCSVVLYILIAAVLAIVGRPLVDRLWKLKFGNWQMPRTLAASITLLLMWVIIGGLGILFIPLVISKVNELLTLDWNGLATSLQAPLASLEESINSLFATPVVDVVKIMEDIFSKVFSGDILSTFTNVASSIASIGIAAFSITFITFFFLRDDGLFYKIVALFFPERFQRNIYHALDSITSLLTRYFGGLMVESTILMVVISVAMLLFGMKPSNALVTGLIMGIMNLVPYAGPVIGCLISIVLGVITPIDGDMGYTAIVIASTIMVVKIIDDFIIQPTLYSERVNAHPLEIFLVILISGHIGGVVGMLLAIPLYTVVRVIAREFFSEYGVVRRLTGKMDEK
ncbi:MAG: AI-2E family transporter [Alistipes sp.]|nr:AI-2E family transporter [Alistipes sp.]